MHAETKLFKVILKMTLYYAKIAQMIMKFIQHLKKTPIVHYQFKYELVTLVYLGLRPISLLEN